MLQNLLSNRKTSGVVLGALAAFAYYKYSKMSAEEKSNLTNMILEKGKGLLGQFMPGGQKTDSTATGTNNYSEAGL